MSSMTDTTHNRITAMLALMEAGNLNVAVENIMQRNVYLLNNIGEVGKSKNALLFKLVCACDFYRGDKTKFRFFCLFASFTPHCVLLLNRAVGKINNQMISSILTLTLFITLRYKFKI